jgi:peptidoglycan-associated lipoprotein
MFEQLIFWEFDMNLRFLSVVAILLALTGCATRQQAPTQEPMNNGDSFSDNGSGAVVAAPSPVVSAAILAAEKLKSVEPSVYFDYDKFEVKDRYIDSVQAFAEYLRTHPQSKILIEGNCDERGTIEYNLALGQKRADAVRSRLLVVGIDGSRIETISNGEEKARNSMKSEAGYSVNRRADLIIR